MAFDEMIFQPYCIFLGIANMTVILSLLFSIAPPAVAPPFHVPSSSQFILTCLSSGSPATIVTWARDGTQVSPDGSTILQTQVITNRATATYENILTLSLQPTDLVGSYSCRVDNTLGTSGFSEALTIYGKGLSVCI